ncbi:hypothetical protein ACOMHN_056073 [Nucella lapillus]
MGATDHGVICVVLCHMLIRSSSTLCSNSVGACQSPTEASNTVLCRGLNQRPPDGAGLDRTNHRTKADGLIDCMID